MNDRQAIPISCSNAAATAISRPLLRHFEELTYNETAVVLGIQKTAASNRCIRTLKRLRDVLETMPGFLDEGE